MLAVMNYFVFKAGLEFALDATGGAGNRCPDNSFPPCFGLRDALIYTLLFVLIGLFTGLVSKRRMPNGEETSYVANCILGIIGSLIGGLSRLALRHGYRCPKKPGRNMMRRNISSALTFFVQGGMFDSVDGAWLIHPAKDAR
jgi:uncharacterized membrane protein YeaQ/YmgE (transglycosylase-associated protein family)